MKLFNIFRKKQEVQEPTVSEIVEEMKQQIEEVREELEKYKEGLEKQRELQDEVKEIVRGIVKGQK